MKNIHLTLCVVLLLFISDQVYSQIIIGGSYTYHFPILQKTVPDGNFEPTTEENQTLNSVFRYSYGKGQEIGLNIGYMTKKKFLFGLAFSWLKGGETERKIILTRRSSISRFKANTIRLSPYIRSFFPLNATGRLSMYTQVGGLIGLKHDSFLDNRSQDQSVLSSIEKERSLKGISLGLIGGLGIHYKLSPHFFLSLGVKAVIQNFSPDRSETTKYIVDGVDVIAQMTTRGRITDYFDSLIVDYTAPPASDDLPSKALKTSIPFSGLGVELGVQYSL